MVRIRGWYFPYIELSKSPQVNINWVGQSVEWEITSSLGVYIRAGNSHF